MKEKEFIRLVKKFSNIYIYGAGAVGRLVLRRLNEYSISITNFLITEVSEGVNKCEGVKILNLGVAIDQNESILIVAATDLFRKEMLENAKKKKFKNIIEVGGELLLSLKENDQKKYLLRNQMMYPPLDLEKRMLIQPGMKILIIAPHPDDEVIGCGGLIAKYNSQIDVMCVNSSGVKYEWNEESAVEIAELRIKEFYHVMEKAGIKKSWLPQIWGEPPMFQAIMSHFEEYGSHFPLCQYDLIFCPDRFDGHREHQFVTNYFLPRLLKINGWKENLKIVMYEVWAALKDPNYYENISSCLEEKSGFIQLYESRKTGNYEKRILALNYYRGQAAGCDYAEAYRVEELDQFLSKIIEVEMYMEEGTE